MALLEEWVLAEGVTAALSGRVGKLLTGLLPTSIEHKVTLDGEYLYVDVRVPDEELDDLATDLDEPLDHFTGWSWQEEIDELEGRDTYAIRVELVEKAPETFDADRELPILSVYSKDRDNHAAWPLAFIVAARLAHELGAQEPDEFLAKAKAKAN